MLKVIKPMNLFLLRVIMENLYSSNVHDHTMPEGEFLKVPFNRD